MNRPARFLYGLSNLLSASALYGPEHPARRRASDTACSHLRELVAHHRRPVFNFLEDEVVFGNEPLREMKGWTWTRRLADAGIQRLEIVEGVQAEELEGFAAEISNRLELTGERVRAAPHPHFRYGSLGVKVGDPTANVRDPVADLPFSLHEESEAVAWINERAGGGEVPTAEATAVVRGLSVAMHQVRQLVAPLLRIKSTDQYTTAHCINVSILSMSLAEYLKFGGAEVRAIGEAALLHDIGKTRIPLQVLNKPGILTAEERAVIERHPVEGARLLLGGKARHGLAATVAYEHHMHFEGSGGYPARHYPRKPHRFSRLIQVCDVYDALRTRRPFRAPLSAEATLHFLDQRAGREFDPDLVTAFVEMMRHWEPRTIAAEEEPDAIDVAELSRLPDGFYDADTERAGTPGEPPTR